MKEICRIFYIDWLNWYNKAQEAGKKSAVKFDEIDALNEKCLVENYAKAGKAMITFHEFILNLKTVKRND
jgi:hypothetical protein